MERQKIADMNWREELQPSGVTINAEYFALLEGKWGEGWETRLMDHAYIFSRRTGFVTTAREMLRAWMLHMAISDDQGGTIHCAVCGERKMWNGEGRWDEEATMLLRLPVCMNSYCRFVASRAYQSGTSGDGQENIDEVIQAIDQAVDREDDPALLPLTKIAHANGWHRQHTRSASIDNLLAAELECAHCGTETDGMRCKECWELFGEVVCAPRAVGLGCGLADPYDCCAHVQFKHNGGE
jgi:hypothetical protein